MKICYVADIGNPHTRRWAGEFAALGHEVLVLSDGQPPNPPPPPGVKVACPRWSLAEKILAFRLYPKPFGNNRWKHLPYRRALGDFQPNLIHGMEALFNGYATAHLLGDGGPPRILSPWGNDILHDPFQSEKARRLVGHALNRVEHITGNMPGLEDYLAAHFKVPREKASFFSWGADLEVFHLRPSTNTAALREEMGIPPHARIILSPRNFSPYWGVQTLIQAIPRIIEKMPSAHFVLLLGSGDAQFLDAQMEYLRAKRCAHHVSAIWEFLPRQKLADLFCLAEVFLSIPHTDFLAQTLLEGMACGCVPICRNLHAYRERVENMVTGKLVPDPLDEESLALAIVETLYNRDALAQMGRKAAERVRALDDSRMALRKMAHLYCTVTRREEFLQNL